ncbi:MAG: metallophosphoesterase family protein [Candidatus Aenigmarchaeota archaeon]|nr:metallophosphoesterase family protein [Candidatus Aenigmarchaeota archaeon]
MKLAFISDTHSNLEPLESALEEIDRLKIKNIFCLGDVISFIPITTAQNLYKSLFISFPPFRRHYQPLYPNLPSIL